MSRRRVSAPSVQTGKRHLFVCARGLGEGGLGEGRRRSCSLCRGEDERDEEEPVLHLRRHQIEEAHAEKMHKSCDDHEIPDGRYLDCCKVPGRCSFYKWLADYRKVVAGKELQLIGDHCGGICSSLQVAGDMKIRSGWIDERKIDKLINLVQILVVISVVVVIVVFFGVIALLVK